MYWGILLSDLVRVKMALSLDLAVLSEGHQPDCSSGKGMVVPARAGLEAMVSAYNSNVDRQCRQERVWRLKEDLGKKPAHADMCFVYGVARVVASDEVASRRLVGWTLD